MNEEKELVEVMNQKHAIVMMGGKCVVMNEIINPVFKRPDINFSKIADFKNRYSNKKVTPPGEKKPICIAKLWFSLNTVGNIKVLSSYLGRNLTNITTYILVLMLNQSQAIGHCSKNIYMKLSHQGIKRSTTISSPGWHIWFRILVDQEQELPLY